MNKIQFCHTRERATADVKTRVQLCWPSEQLPWCLFGTPIQFTEFSGKTERYWNLSTSRVGWIVRNVDQSRRFKDPGADALFGLDRDNRCIDMLLCSWKIDGCFHYPKTCGDAEHHRRTSRFNDVC